MSHLFLVGPWFGGTILVVPSAFYIATASSVGRGSLPRASRLAGKAGRLELGLG